LSAHETIFNLTQTLVNETLQLRALDGLFNRRGGVPVYQRKEPSFFRTHGQFYLEQY
jgi:hypothetical protein